MAAHPPAPSSSVAKLCLTLGAAAVIVVLGQVMANQLPNSYPSPAATAAPIATVAPLPNSPADLNGGSRGFPSASLTVNQHLP